MTVVIFFQTGSSYISAVAWIELNPDEIWFDRSLTTQESDVTQTETGSSIVPPPLPS